MKVKLFLNDTFSEEEFTEDDIAESKDFCYRVMIGGGRDFDGYENYSLMKGTFIEAIRDRENLIGNRTLIIVEGGARGADDLAKRLAMDLGIPCEEHPAKWNNLNEEGAATKVNMINMSDLVILFHDGKSHETKDDLDYSTKNNKDLIYIKY